MSQQQSGYHHPHHHPSAHYPQQHQQHQHQHQQQPPVAAPDPTRPTPRAPTSSSGIILHQPYPNSVGAPPAQPQYAQHPHQHRHHTAHRPTASTSSAVSPPPIPTHTRPIDMPQSPARPGSTNYGVSLPLLPPSMDVPCSMFNVHQWNAVGSFLALPVLAPATVHDTRSLHAYRPSPPSPARHTLLRGPVPKLPRPPKVAPERE